VMNATEYLCLSTAGVSVKRRPKHQTLLCILPMNVAPSAAGSVAIRQAYVLPVFVHDVIFAQNGNA